MKDLSRQRCFNHGLREAVARCPECGRYFCRECITEHEDRVLCSSCLSTISASSMTGPHYFSEVARVAQSLLGGMGLWLFFYYLGRILLSLPSSFHEGTLWQGPW